MIVLDAAPVLAFSRDEHAAAEVEAMLEDRSEQTVISATNLAEVVDRLIRRFGYEPDEAVAGLRLLRAAGLDVLFVDDIVAEAAGQLRARYYRRKTDELSLADCVALATARGNRAALATSDAALARATRAEDVELIALADSAGNRP